MENSGLAKEDLDKIKEVFSKYEQIEKVLIYGSRAMGTFQPASDIDLVLIGENIDSNLQTQIEFDLDDLMLPYKLDISIYKRITNPELIDHINRVGKELYNKKHNENTTTYKRNAE